MKLTSRGGHPKKELHLEEGTIPGSSDETNESRKVNVSGDKKDGGKKHKQQSRREPIVTNARAKEKQISNAGCRKLSIGVEEGRGSVVEITKKRTRDSSFNVPINWNTSVWLYHAECRQVIVKVLGRVTEAHVSRPEKEGQSRAGTQMVKPG